MSDFEIDRPNPDELLAALARKDEKSKRGKLKIFFGMCAGVGKTYTMLQAAHIEKKKGTDIVIGYVETHKRKETEALVHGFEIIPRKAIEYKSTSVEEMDLDAINIFTKLQSKKKPLHNIRPLKSSKQSIIGV